MLICENVYFPYPPHTVSKVRSGKRCLSYTVRGGIKKSTDTRSRKLKSFTDSFVQVFAADSWFLLFSTSKGMPACGIPCKHSRNLSLLAGISTSRPPCRVRVPVRTCRGQHAGPRYFFYAAAILKRLTQELDVQPPCLFRSVAYSEIKPNL